jgi:predicted MFS family arabinose efflux permease
MNLLKKDEKTHLGLFYLHTTVEASFGIIWVYWIVYLLDQGFSYSVIGIALAVNGLSMAFLEVPTGAVADAVSRKVSVLAGLIGFAVVLFIIPSITNPVILAMLFALWGLPISLISGAEEAWVVDNLRYEEREDLIKEFYVKNASLHNFGQILAALLSGMVVRFFNMDALWYIYGGALLASVFILVFQKEHFERKATGVLHGFKETYENIIGGAQFTVKEKNILFIIIALFFMVIGGELILICSKPFLEVMGIPREYLGYLSAVSAALCVGTPFLARHAAGLFRKEPHYLLVHSLVFSIVTASVILVGTPEIAALLFIVMMLRGTLFWPVLEPFFQHFLPQKLRATIGSFRNMVVSIALLVGDGIISLFADATGPQVMIAVGGIVMLPSILFYMSIKNSRTEMTPSP